MIPTVHYFSNVAAVISYAPAGYVRLDWQPVPASASELRSIYEHVLRAMQHHRSTALMSVHNQRPPMPADVQEWLTQTWIPRAVAEVGYGRCAIVEATMPLSRLAARAVGIGLKGQLSYEFFATDTEADSWLRK
ncbi:hypothetical protein I2I05_12745 [Hymenobacter sp. BT683]|uniref:STAS/SEC14 domain-containing protein n=1 Tax=Hymenobacter jeongseonensis TaxID=2791027 RepID=A0ABS0IKI0_9BACT|nr:hypothetical protein [Hymenobacter jeongseonensis]MBF9238265.1 hypothetical protein [Hymenobacter jeongseonensis]